MHRATNLSDQLLKKNKKNTILILFKNLLFTTHFNDLIIYISIQVKKIKKTIKILTYLLLLNDCFFY